MGNTVGESDLRRAVEVIDAAQHASAPSGHLPSEVLAALLRLVPCEQVTFADMDVDARIHYVLDEWDGTMTMSAPDANPDELFWAHYATSPSCSYPTVTGDQLTVTRSSDFHTQLGWRASPAYCDVFRTDHINWEMMCCLPSLAPRSRRVMFFRSGPMDFTDRDRMVLTLLRPHLAEAYVRSTAPTVAELTTRQRQLMGLVAQGKTNAEIAAELIVSPHTVRKHLENVFTRLGVTTRAAAVARLNLRT